MIGSAEDSWSDQEAADEPAEIVVDVIEEFEDEAPAPAPTSSEEADRLFASPRARKLASNKDVDLMLVTPTGPEGRILERDVLAYLEQRPGITPVARKLAEEAKLDVYAIAGNGPGGRITKRDVEQAIAEAKATTAAPSEPAFAPPVSLPPRPFPLPYLKPMSWNECR